MLANLHCAAGNTDLAMQVLAPLPPTVELPSSDLLKLRFLLSHTLPAAQNAPQALRKSAAAVGQKRKSLSALGAASKRAKSAQGADMAPVVRVPELARILQVRKLPLHPSSIVRCTAATPLLPL